MTIEKVTSLINSATELRHLAEERLNSDLAESSPLRSEEATQRLVHELGVYQIEMEVQNCELRRAQEELENQQVELEMQNEELKRVQEDLELSRTEIQDAREYAENIVETVRKPLVVLDSDLKIVTANHSFYETFMVEPKETIGNYIYEIGNRQWDIPKLRVLFEDILPNNTVLNGYEVDHNFPGIGRKIILLNARQIFREKIGSHIILLAMEDITDRKKSEEDLLKAGALQRAIFNSANFSSIATDAKGVIQIFNVGAERMLGYSAAEVMNKITPADISDPEELIARAKTLSAELETPITPGFDALVFKARRTIEDIYELTYIRKDGSRFPAVVSVTALRDEQNIIIGYLLIGTDNTARKQADAERARLDQILQDKNVELEKAMLVAEKANLAKSDFLSSMSHELRTPLGDCFPLRCPATHTIDRKNRRRDTADRCRLQL